MSEDTGNNIEWLTVPAMAHELGISQDKVRTWCRNGSLASINIGDRRNAFFRVQRSEWERFKATRRKSSPAPIARRRLSSGTNLLGV